MTVLKRNASNAKTAASNGGRFVFGAALQKQIEAAAWGIRAAAFSFVVSRVSERALLFAAIFFCLPQGAETRAECLGLLGEQPARQFRRRLEMGHAAIGDQRRQAGAPRRQDLPRRSQSFEHGEILR